jgi:isocitrate dehydrogenase
MKRTFEEVAPEYSEPSRRTTCIVDNCRAPARARAPEQFEVIVTTNMNGDILSGPHLRPRRRPRLRALRQPRHRPRASSRPSTARRRPNTRGRDVANPTAVILSAVLLLHHIGEAKAAMLLENAVLATLEDGRAVPRDVVGDAAAAGTRRYTDEILKNFGRTPTSGAPRAMQPIRMQAVRVSHMPAAQEQVVGLDVFVESKLEPSELGARLEAAARGLPFRLKMISNRGTVVYPPTGATTDTVDCHRCRFLATSPATDLSAGTVSPLLAAVEAAGLKWMHLEKLNQYNGKPGFTRAQGED